MEELIKLLSDCLPKVDFAAQTALVDDGVIDSLDIMTIITELSDAYDIEIPPEEITPENFNSAEGLWSMVERLKDE